MDDSTTASEPPGDLFGLHPQTQPTGKTCVQTCLAMALGVPVAEVIARYGEEPMNQQSLCAALTECAFVWNQLVTGTMVCQGWYFATVPSLNHRGGNHQVLIRWTSDDGVTVLDPAMGNRYAQNGSDLISWSCLTPFWPGGALPR